MEIDVPPLSSESSVALAEAATEASPLPPHEIEALVQRSAGNPLFLLDLIAAVPTLGVESLPESLEDVVTVRIDLLAPDDRMMLRYGSVIGTSFTEADLRTVARDESFPPDEATWERLAEFIQADGDGTLSFRQTLVRDVAYGQLPFRKRRELHARFADALLVSGRELEAMELLAIHFFQAGRHDQAWRFSRSAGDRALAKYANAEARRFYRQALDAGRRLHEVSEQDLAEVQEALGEVTERLGDFPNARAAYRAARRMLPDDRVAQGRLLLKEAWIPHRLGQYAVALRTLTRGLRALDGAAGPEAATQRARLSASYAAILRDGGRTRECAEWSRRAIAEAEMVGDLDALGHASSILSWAYATSGNPEYRPLAERALEIYRQLGDLGKQAHVLTYLGAFAYFEGKWEEALQYYQRGKEARERTGDAVSAAYGTINIGEILSDQGHLGRAEELFRSALRVWTAAGYRAGVAALEQQLARVAARAGRYDDALRLYEHSRAEFRAVGDRTSVVEVDAKIAECYLWRGEPERALRQVAGAVPSTEGMGVLTPMLRRVEGLALLDLRDLDGARAALEESLRVARARNAQYEVGLTLGALADVLSASHDDGAAMAAESASILDRLGVMAVPAG